MDSVKGLLYSTCHTMVRQKHETVKAENFCLRVKRTVLCIVIVRLSK